MQLPGNAFSLLLLRLGDLIDVETHIIPQPPFFRYVPSDNLDSYRLPIGSDRPTRRLDDCLRPIFPNQPPLILAAHGPTPYAPPYPLPSHCETAGSEQPLHIHTHE